MRMRAHCSGLLVVLLSLTTPAQAWNPATHAGIAEQAVFASTLHTRLVSLGWSKGLLEPLTLPNNEAPELAKALRRLPASAWVVPDTTGTQPAWAWFVAGAAVASQPPSVEVHHSGGAALAWLRSKENPFGVTQFALHWERAQTAETGAARSAHAAAALVAAGAIAHVLADTASPPRARDESPMNESRLETLAALAYGRLSVPAPSQLAVGNHATLADFFAAGADAKSLMAWVARSFFSEHTLPRDGSATAAVKLALPAPTADGLALILASSDRGATLRAPSGRCFTRYVVRDNRLHFFMDDACLLEQATVLLPLIGAETRGLIDRMFSSELVVRPTGADVEVSATNPVPAGTLTIVAESATGARKVLASNAVAAGATGVIGAASPSDAVRVIAVLTATDRNTDPVVLVAAQPLP